MVAWFCVDDSTLCWAGAISKGSDAGGDVVTGDRGVKDSGSLTWGRSEEDLNSLDA
jgi:hypothetical protein